MKSTITKKDDGFYKVETDELMSDLNYRMDGYMKLSGNELKSHEEKGLIRIGGLMKLVLGPNSLAKVSALKSGESVVLG